MAEFIDCASGQRVSMENNFTFDPKGKKDAFKGKKDAFKGKEDALRS